MKTRGFTIIELISAVVLLFILGTFFIIQKNDLQANDRDSARKSSINAIYYNLTEIFYLNNKFYPRDLVSTDLKGLDPEALKDPSGLDISAQASTLRYEPHECNQSKCKSFTLRANLEREADFIKEN